MMMPPLDAPVPEPLVPIATACGFALLAWLERRRRRR